MEDKSEQYISEGSPEPLPSTLVPIALGLIGIALGGAALYFSFTGPARVDNEKETDVAVESQIRSIEENLIELKGENKALRTDLLSLAQQTQTALKKISDEFGRIRNEMAKADDMGAPEGHSAPTTGSGAAEKTPTSEVSSETPALGEFYTIQAGDTFAKLARRFGTSIDALLKANPGVDPRNLQIGQKIVTPAH